MKQIWIFYHQLLLFSFTARQDTLTAQIVWWCDWDNGPILFIAFLLIGTLNILRGAEGMLFIIILNIILYCSKWPRVWMFTGTGGKVDAGHFRLSKFLRKKSRGRLFMSSVCKEDFVVCTTKSTKCLQVPIEISVHCKAYNFLNWGSKDNTFDNSLIDVITTMSCNDFLKHPLFF